MEEIDFEIINPESGPDIVKSAGLVCNTTTNNECDSDPDFEFLHTSAYLNVDLEADSGPLPNQTHHLDAIETTLSPDHQDCVVAVDTELETIHISNNTFEIVGSESESIPGKDESQARTISHNAINLVDLEFEPLDIEDDTRDVAVDLQP